MKRKLFTLLFTMLASVGTMFAWDYERVQIGDLYYNLDASNQTAEVTSQNSAYPYWSTSITVADIPSSVTYNAVVYSVTSIGYSAFRGCTGLTSVTIGNSVTSIGDGAFRDCTGLTSVEIPNSVTSIGLGAFAFCTGLTSVTIPNSVTSIGDGAFDDCGLTGPVYNAHVFAFMPTSYSGAYAIPDGIKSIAGGSFYNCRSLTSITIPNSVTSIGFAAFEGCTCLTSITIPNSLTSIGEYAFWNCTSLTSIDASTNNPNYCSVDGVLFNKDMTKLFIYPSGKQGAYTIPNSVTSIGTVAFGSCTGLTSITIPNSVTSIGEHAFLECHGLTKVNITDIAAWCKINFADDFSNPLTYADHLYLNDIEITNLIIPNNVSEIRSYAFYGCAGLTSITIPNSVTSIGYAAFEWCTNMTSVTIGNSVTSIGKSAFRDCTGLTSVTIPNSVTSIGNSAFYGCIGLTSVTIPNSVTSIGNSAFYECTGLKSITCEAVNPPAINSSVFKKVDKSIPLYVHAGSINAYKTADQWKEFTNILPIGAKATEVTTPTVEPEVTSAEIAWPVVSGAASYELVIKDANGRVVCTLTFNAQGQLTAIVIHAPARNDESQQTQSAGFAYIVTGLDPGTQYNYSIIAKNAFGTTLNTETGSFTTLSPEGIDDVMVNNQLEKGQKILHNGQILILRGNRTYTLTGQEVK